MCSSLVECSRHLKSSLDETPGVLAPRPALRLHRGSEAADGARTAGTFTLDATSSSVCSIVGPTVGFSVEGTCTIDATEPGNAQYSAAPQVQQSFRVDNKNSQTITFTSTRPGSALVGGPTYVVRATASPGLPVSCSAETPSMMLDLGGDRELHRGGDVHHRRKPGGQTPAMARLPRRRSRSPLRLAQRHRSPKRSPTPAVSRCSSCPGVSPAFSHTHGRRIDAYAYGSEPLSQEVLECLSRLTHPVFDNPMARRESGQSVDAAVAGCFSGLPAARYTTSEMHAAVKGSGCRG